MNNNNAKQSACGARKSGTIGAKGMTTVQLAKFIEDNGTIEAKASLKKLKTGAARTRGAVCVIMHMFRAGREQIKMTNSRFRLTPSPNRVRSPNTPPSSKSPTSANYKKASNMMVKKRVFQTMKNKMGPKMKMFTSNNIESIMKGNTRSTRRKYKQGSNKNYISRRVHGVIVRTRRQPKTVASNGKPRVIRTYGKSNQANAGYASNRSNNGGRSNAGSNAGNNKNYGNEFGNREGFTFANHHNLTAKTAKKSEKKNNYKNPLGGALALGPRVQQKKPVLKSKKKILLKSSSTNSRVPTMQNRTLSPGKESKVTFRQLYAAKKLKYKMYNQQKSTAKNQAQMNALQNKLMQNALKKVVQMNNLPEPTRVRKTVTATKNPVTRKNIMKGIMFKPLPKSGPAKLFEKSMTRYTGKASSNATNTNTNNNKPSPNNRLRKALKAHRSP